MLRPNFRLKPQATTAARRTGLSRSKDPVISRITLRKKGGRVRQLNVGHQGREGGRGRQIHQPYESNLFNRHARTTLTLAAIDTFARSVQSRALFACVPILLGVAGVF